MPGLVHLKNNSGAYLSDKQNTWVASRGVLVRTKEVPTVGTTSERLNPAMLQSLLQSLCYESINYFTT